MYHHILVTTDGSELSQKAIDSAIGLAKPLQADIWLLRIVAPYPRSYFDGSARVTVAEVERTEKENLEAARESLLAIKRAAESQGSVMHTVVALSESVSETIIETAKKHDCDLIVMASHGRRGVARLLLGSETQHVLTHSHIPVLVLR